MSVIDKEVIAQQAGRRTTGSGPQSLSAGIDGIWVLLTDEPVPFHPTNKTANVVHLKSLDQAIRHVNVATQTVGVYPETVKATLRDRLANAGAQRVVRLGSASKHVMGSPHDAMFPLQRMVHWMSQENA